MNSKVNFIQKIHGLIFPLMALGIASMFIGPALLLKIDGGFITKAEQSENGSEQLRSLLKNDSVSVLVSGIITDVNDKLPIPGVTVRLKGKNITTISSKDGKYSILVPKKDFCKLIFSLFGYKNFKTKISCKTNIILNVVMMPYGGPAIDTFQ